MELHRCVQLPSEPLTTSITCSRLDLAEQEADVCMSWHKPGPTHILPMQPCCAPTTAYFCSHAGAGL